MSGIKHMENILFCVLLMIRNKNQVIGMQGNRFKILTIGKSRHFLPNFIKISCQKKRHLQIGKSKRLILTWSCSLYQDVTFYARILKMGNFLRRCLFFWHFHNFFTFCQNVSHFLTFSGNRSFADLYMGLFWKLRVSASHWTLNWEQKLIIWGERANQIENFSLNR